VSGRLRAVLTKKSKYGLKALSILAQRAGQGPVLITDLAEHERIPQKFLEAILLELKRHGILQSKKGKGGGYFLRSGPDEVTIGQVIRLLDGPLALVPCASQTAYQPCDDCLDVNTCAIRLTMKKVRDATAGILDHTTLSDLAARTAPNARPQPEAASPRPGRNPRARPART
jgi:Rrf2 family protein